MNTLLWNKIAAALLLALLLYKGIEIFAEGAFEVAEPGTKAYVVEGLEVEAPEIAVVAEPAALPQDIMALLAVASPEQGKRVFRRCQACHDVAQGTGHKIGPNLFAVMGAPLARHGDYRYSDALASHGGTWDFTLMDDWLSSAAAAIPGNKMSFGGIPKAGDRAALIAYMNSNSDTPLALPAALPVPVPVTPPAVEEAAPEVMDEAVDETDAESAVVEDTAPAQEVIEEADAKAGEGAVEQAMPADEEAVDEMIVEPTEDAGEAAAKDAAEGATEAGEEGATEAGEVDSTANENASEDDS